MIFTNKYSFPQPLVDAIDAISKEYDKGEADFSVTELAKPAYMVRLERDHANELTEDVSDCIWRVMGSSLHGLMARARGDYLVEQRLFGIHKGHKISGSLDVYFPTTGEIWDYKLTSCWSVKGPLGYKKDWEKQLNCYAWLVWKNKMKVGPIRVLAFLRDWNRHQAVKDHDFPQSDTKIIQIPVWKRETTEKYIEERAKTLRTYLDTAFLNQLAVCSPEERWATENKWAVMLKGKERAIKLFPENEKDNAQSMVDRLKKKGKDYLLEFRKGADNRCSNYCLANKWCSYYNEHVVAL